ncbi:D-alanine--D-alanine ligase [Clostridium ganghwense]|uniref:D-alanine--D-alanine ligase n=1 Tax=Clostridium ganghwense TaxID=312089 RepID=A0ABT4CPH7_9CLOT|nr:D-alanine--D-alanine ligase [Clostridium ganghwense]MCY6370136.1 D-alanine--D-alanine ligase [Clostridium ganghwense]
MMIGVIMGGTSSEREISLLTGKEIIENLDKEKYEVLPMPITTGFELIDKVKCIDFAFIALHGTFGEDGKVQSVLETIDIPYSGSGVLSSALCMDKNMSKKILKAEGIKTPDWIMVKSLEDIDYNILEKMEYPLVIKPNCGGSSIGTFIVKDNTQVEKTVCEALKYDSEIVIEKYIQGKELTCCILNGEVLPMISIKPKSEFFDYSSKYDAGGAEEKIIELPSELKNKVEDIATKCWNVFKCSSYARVDIILKDEEIFVLEINTLPGMTKNSLFPKSAKAKGIGFSQLLDHIIEYSIEKED